MKILLIEDHIIVRKGCVALLSSVFPDLEVMEVEAGESALQLIQSFIPNIVLLDMSLPGISGLETCRRLLTKFPQLPILFFSMHDQLSLVRQALSVGAAGYITKGCNGDILIEAVRRVSAGYTYIEHHLANALAYDKSGEGNVDPRLATMSSREIEVFVMVAKGLAKAEISEKLCVSPKTIANYITVLKQKLQVNSHIELVHAAIDIGVLNCTAA